MKKVLIIFFSIWALVSCSSNGSYYSFLCRSYAKPKNLNTEVFYGKAVNFWMSRVDTLNEFSHMSNDTLRLFLTIQDSIRRQSTHDCLRFAEEINEFIKYDTENSKIEKPVLFIGSSTINLWKTALYFPDINVMNRGFGGAGIKDILYYYDDVIGKYSPASVVIYDDIEIENGDSAESAFSEYLSLLERIHRDFPECRIILISVKPTPMDFLLGKDVRNNKMKLNDQLKKYADSTPLVEYIDLASLLYDADGNLNLNYYSEDRMHFNESGYALWSKELNKIF